jgi:hypothetical protein
VVKEASASVQYPTLTRTNYNEWSLLMKVNMQAQGIWQAIKPEEEDVVEYREDRLAIAAILRAVPPEMLASLTTKRIAQSSWEAIRSHRVGVQKVREANAEQLHKEFTEIQFKDGESIDDFSMCITGLANNIAVLGGSISEGEIVKKILHVAPEPLEQVAISIETLLDVNNLSIEEVTGHLQNVEQRKKNVSGTTTDKQGRLLLTEEEWATQVKSCDSSNKGGGSGGGDSVKKNKPQVKLGPDGKPIRCSNCGKKGHLGKDCWSKPKKGKAHVAQTEEEESSMFLVSAATDTSSIPNQQDGGTGNHAATNGVFAGATEELSLGASLDPPSSRVDLREDKVFTQIGENDDNDHR